MKQPHVTLSPADHEKISAAVTRAELQSAGEIVTILADRSDGYTDIALSWSAAVALVALGVMASFPAPFMGTYDALLADWGHEWTPRAIISLAAAIATLKFAGMALIQLWPPLKFALIPGPVKSARVHERAVRAFRIGAQGRTTGRTGVLIYLSMREHRAEIVADEAIATKVDPQVWGDAMQAMLAHVREGRIADGLCAAVEQVGDIVRPHFPRADDEINELPNRLIEV
ncbi:hypothetical protein MTR62_02405 [Novosphingobium sp. 1949]|uniref:TPM domain-containing protein n=1 Tax=Novosphingobium organovorum TaxID=2930092 RepID=A0ABT0B918_9SPHN|nr:TPM domain-containing protein [Novosphingobium organovorum]MCJ2181566.1 hypothetical protein [Novosphingobium organovorum]